MFAGVRGIGTGTLGEKIFLAVWQKIEIQFGKDLLNCVRHFIEQKLSDKICSRGDLLDNFVPVGRADSFDGNGGLVEGFFIDPKIGVDRTTHFGGDSPVGNGIVKNTAIMRVGTSTSQTSFVGKCFQGGNKTLAPPGATKCCHGDYSITALCRSAIRSLKVSLSSSVSQPSSLPTTSEERRFLSSIIMSMRSSIVPISRTLCTKTFLR